MKTVMKMDSVGFHLIVSIVVFYQPAAACGHLGGKSSHVHVKRLIKAPSVHRGSDLAVRLHIDLTKFLC